MFLDYGLEQLRLGSTCQPEVQQRANSCHVCFRSANVFFRKALLNFPLFDLFDACLISLEETSNHGTPPPQIVLYAFSRV